jgi:hypothetical protein
VSPQVQPKLSCEWQLHILRFCASCTAETPNLSFNRTCFGVAAPGIISFLPGFATLAHAG